MPCRIQHRAVWDDRAVWDAVLHGVPCRVGYGRFRLGWGLPAPAIADAIALIKDAAIDGFADAQYELGYRCHVCHQDSATPAATSAPVPSSLLPYLLRDWARCCHIVYGTGLTPWHTCAATARRCWYLDGHEAWARRPPARVLPPAVFESNGR